MISRPRLTRTPLRHLLLKLLVHREVGGRVGIVVPSQSSCLDPGGEYGGYDRAPPPDYGQQPLPGAPGSFVAGHSMGPPGADSQIWNWFAAVNTDKSGRITVHDLERILKNGDWTPFDIDMVNMLMSIVDKDRKGTIGFKQFTRLWKYIKDWQNVFRHFDRDRSGFIDGGGLREALSQFGFQLSPQLLDLVQRKYGKPIPTYPPVKGTTTSRRYQAAPAISFDRFVRACVAIKQLSEAFQKLDSDRDGWIQINYDQFMRTVLTLL
ncbi:EF-hand [Dendrothele bispora CBS 962.96]|uniref:EF-hand n=1 Tax=Dendrothele bispora (strain CBS 962.96) TaxID=1314807 RepID=A0A4S8KSS9_DENBC|nr:EF-hand [Dendrothele bispora CBS 962.96]